ncbi:mannose-1-phosphate guanylyltransferase [Corynebacterium otitidis]|uniref:nucleotidyltransferase family protein n=1 Tax=Corynebacterium otitidis TaxID=29321 RepID=UPI000627BE36|nr:NDP-sugar synthase [Corynebacterium otitidis]KKO84355.1 GDP-mannose pyrophosphorylase [Corynebacterium otitidis]
MNPKDVDAVILVGGKGTRLRPLTVDTPKPLLPTAGFPFLEHLLARIREAGIRHVVLGTSFRAELFEDYFGTGERLGLEIEYVTEKEPLGTGGAIRNVAGRLRGDTVVVFNGDVLSGANLGAILSDHEASGADATLHLVAVRDPSAYGCVPTDETGRVTGFLEKTEDPPTNQINAGCYVFHRRVVESIPAGRVVSVERETFPGLLEAGYRLQGHVDSSYWRDMGRPADFVRGSSDLVRGIAPSPLLAGHTGESFVDPSAGVSDAAIVVGGTAIGRGTEVGAGCRVDNSVLFDGVTVEPGATIEDSIVASGATIGANARITGCVIGAGATIGARCELEGGARVWPAVEIPDAGIRFSSDA